MNVPSIRMMDGKWPWANDMNGSAHGKAPFLTWHRRFIFVYHKILRNKCHYNGSLP